MRNDTFRFSEITENEQGYRTAYRRDYARVLHSASFRRLEHKTQLFPGNESDFFRNRLTHSLEVAQIAKSIALKLKDQYPNADINPEVCEIAGLMHDLGHPPFGHNGEYALDKCMIHFGGFEGNAQTLRIICRLEKKEFDCKETVDKDGLEARVGLNLTARTIASALKYDTVIPVSRKKTRGLVKGYYHSEQSIVERIKRELCGQYTGKFKTIECAIMDLADDIAYSTYDLEDALKAGFLTPLSIMAVEDSVLEQILEILKKDKIKKTIEDCRIGLYEIFEDIWTEAVSNQMSLATDDELLKEHTLANLLGIYRLSNKVGEDAFYRTKFTSMLVDKFINGIKYEHDNENPILSKVKFDEDIEFKVNLLKHFTYVFLINSPRLKVVENRGGEIVTKIFNRLASDNGHIFMPDDFQDLYHSFNEDVDKKRVICDFIAGMTDRYALEFYGRLYSENPQTIFKPL